MQIELAALRRILSHDSASTAIVQLINGTCDQEVHYPTLRV